MMRRGVPIAAMFCLAALAVAPVAMAAPSARLTYARGPGALSCPDESALRQALVARIGYDPFFPWAPLTISVEIMAAPTGGLQARVVVEKDGFETGAQTIHTADSASPANADGHDARCSDVIGAVALAISVVLDATTSEPSLPAATVEDAAPAPSGGALLATPAPAISPPVAPPATGPDTGRSPSSSRPLSARPLGLWVGLGTRASVGSWSSVWFGPELLVELRYGRFGLGLAGRFDLPAAVGMGDGTSASIERVTGSVLPCAHLGWLVTCGLATFGGSVAQGVGVELSRSGGAPYAAFGGRAGASVKLLPRMELLGTVDVVGIATPIVLQVDHPDGTASAVRSSPVEASGGIALAASIF
jgi:hypothetical protein